jgi:hypothetical protein
MFNLANTQAMKRDGSGDGDGDDASADGLGPAHTDWGWRPLLLLFIGCIYGVVVVIKLYTWRWHNGRAPTCGDVIGFLMATRVSPLLI